MDGKMSLMVSVEPSDAGSLKFVARSVDERHRLTAHEALFVLTFWNEDGDLIRGTIEEPNSKSVAYFQGDGGFHSLAELIKLGIERYGADSPATPSR
jgi:hypothetical protein